MLICLTLFQTKPQSGLLEDFIVGGPKRSSYVANPTQVGGVVFGIQGCIGVTTLVQCKLMVEGRCVLDGLLRACTATL